MLGPELGTFSNFCFNGMSQFNKSCKTDIRMLTPPRHATQKKKIAHDLSPKMVISKLKGHLLDVTR